MIVDPLGPVNFVNRSDEHANLFTFHPDGGDDVFERLDAMITKDLESDDPWTIEIDGADYWDLQPPLKVRASAVSLVEAQICARLRIVEHRQAVIEGLEG